MRLGNVDKTDTVPNWAGIPIERIDCADQCSCDAV